MTALQVVRGAIDVVTDIADALTDLALALIELAFVLHALVAYGLADTFLDGAARPRPERHDCDPNATRNLAVPSPFEGARPA